MMKRIYICLLMLMVLSTATFAQKKGSPEYNAQLRATIIAMDSVLKYSTKTPPDILMKFADEQCAKFKNDPIVMDSIAEAFYRFYNNEIYGERRYSELKRLHPEYTDVYLTEARLFHSMAWYEDAEGWHCKSNLLEKTKTKIDSAKIFMPANAKPYMLWVRLQSKFRHTKLPDYEPPTIDSELAELKKKLPAYPAYLETARYYEEILAKRDKNWLLDAAEFYEKAGENGEMTAPFWVNYSLMCYTYYNNFEPEHGIKIAQKGLQQFPNYPRLLRAKFWNEGRFDKWDDVLETGMKFLELRDTLPMLVDDYRWLGTANLKKKKYSEAIEFFNKQQELGIRDSIQQVACFRNLLDCYNGLDQFEQAIETFSKLKSYKAQNDMEMSIFDYLKIEPTYRNQAIDTTLIAEKRLEYFMKLDTICAIEAKLSPEDVGSVLNRRLNYIMMRIGVEQGEQDIKRPEVLEGAQNLVDAVNALQMNQSEAKRDVRDTYYLVTGYRAIMVHYYFTDQHEEAYKIAEKILYDLPEAMELQGLSAAMANQYQSYKSAAQQIYDTLRPKFATKRR